MRARRQLERPCALRTRRRRRRRRAEPRRLAAEVPRARRSCSRPRSPSATASRCGRSWSPASSTSGFGARRSRRLTERQGADRRARGLPRRDADLAARRRLRRAPLPARRAAARRDPFDAFFESMSGFSTTGVDRPRPTSTAISKSMAMWRQFTAWIGGLGIIVLFLAVLPRLSVGGRQALFKTEVAGPELGSPRRSARPRGASSRSTSRSRRSRSLVLTVFGRTGHRPAHDALQGRRALVRDDRHRGVLHRGPLDRAVRAATQWVVVVFMVVAGTNFALLYAGLVLRRPRLFAARRGVPRLPRAARRSPRRSSSSSCSPRTSRTASRPSRHAVFNTVSMMTTTGFANADFNLWTSLTVARAVRASLLLGRLGRLDDRLDQARSATSSSPRCCGARSTRPCTRSSSPRCASTGRDRRARAAGDHRLRLPLPRRLRRRRDGDPRRLGAARRRADAPSQSLADSAPLLGGVGPGLGFAGPMGSFAPFSDLSTLVLTALMYLGRLEIIPVLVLFTAQPLAGVISAG